ncbi:Uncharacterized protein C31H12.03c [Colletotrichum chlorophyti]|uniref:Uncharacterized protein C31H12.03c n=1 Tax=Colletotrichum chlorophyti TaxID=708187 RepID=A0A1Q8RX40_9PEZI|nr:Uncharacterized protein C31H12.03c [Colletotrichum chlorophyti]
MATDYSSLKVPELKKLLQERGLPATGNKLDLVNRLKENDKASSGAADEDEIDYSDDEPTPAKAPDAPKPATEPAPVAEESASTPAPAAAQPAAPAAAPATEAATEAAPEAETTASEEKPTEEAAEAVPKENFALNLDATDAAEEARKRAERAKRFGITEDEETKKKNERAKKFGTETPTISGLDSALPERRPKRGRPERNDEQPGRDSKRQSTDGRGRRGRGGNRNGRPGGRQGGGGGSGGSGGERRSAAVDPAEKAKMEARAKRFAS